MWNGIIVINWWGVFTKGYVNNIET